jgi:DNA-binding response OmpR family regulator
MAFHRYEEARIVVAGTLSASRDTLRNCLLETGFHQLQFCEDTDQVREIIENQNVDLLICDASDSEHEFITLIRELRDMQQPGDAFLPIMTLTWAPTAEIIHRIVNCGTDLILTLPLSMGKMRNAIDTLISKRKPFVVTSTYIGPDRRKDPRPGTQEVESITVPNALRHKVTGDDGGINVAEVTHKIREQRVERSAARITWTVGTLVASVREQGDADVCHLIDELMFTARDLNNRIGETRYAHQLALSESLLGVAHDLVEKGSVSEADLELLPQLALALELAMGRDDAGSIEAALDISRTVRNLPMAAE